MRCKGMGEFRCLPTFGRCTTSQRSQRVRVQVIGLIDDTILFEPICFAHLRGTLSKSYDRCIRVIDSTDFYYAGENPLPGWIDCSSALRNVVVAER
jgi:hypothetical protein